MPPEVGSEYDESYADFSFTSTLSLRRPLAGMLFAFSNA